MKVLIVSHNCFSTTQNMGKTLMSLFSRFKKEELMQLYLYPSIPDVDVCESLYRMTDIDAVRSILKRRECGRVVLPKQETEAGNLFEKKEDAEQFDKINRNSFLVRRLRDLAWKMSSWKNNDLKQWLKNGKPDVVFYASGDSAFSQNIAMWVSDFLKIPLVTYVCDEYYYYYNEVNRINFGLTKNIKKTIEKSSLLVTICDELGKAYQNSFGVPYITVMTGSSFSAGSFQKTCEKKQISYIGNLSLNRWKSLIDIADVIEEINNENSENFSLVYYGSKNDNLDGKIKYGGRLDVEGVKQAMLESLMLVHTETFDKEFRARLKYSVSTKIADSLASGTPLIAYGPTELASMQHLIKNGCAIVAEDKNTLKRKLSEALAKTDFIKKYGEKAIETAEKLHCSRVNSEKLYKALSLICEGK